jgi:DNA-binding GntR family transcriptional regulator
MTLQNSVAMHDTEEPVATAEPKQRNQVNETVYQSLKRLIQTNQLRPGNRLPHEELAKKLGVSRTPIREALERLYQEGYVAHVPRRGFFVADINVAEVEELYQLREALETYALRKSMEKGVPANGLKRLEDLCRQYEELAERNLTMERVLLDREFHLAMAALAGNGQIVNSISAVFDRIIQKRRVEGYVGSDGMKPYNEHVLLLDAIRANDAARAEKLLVEHLHQGWARFFNHLKTFSAS